MYLHQLLQFEVRFQPCLLMGAIFTLLPPNMDLTGKKIETCTALQAVSPKGASGMNGGACVISATSFRSIWH